MLETLRDLSGKLSSEKPEFDSVQNLQERDASQDPSPSHSGPIEPAISTTLSPDVGIEESLETIPDVTGSSSSLASSMSSSHPRTSEASAETEEDEGMILVGRPST